MPPLSMMIKPASGMCNMCCSYCFYKDEMSHRSVASFGIMSDETLENLIRRVFTYADSHVSLAFQGGEPTLAGVGFYTKLLALEKSYNTRRQPVQHAIQTNGLHLSDDLLNVFKQGHFLVGVSVDGYQAIHDSRRLDQSGQGTYARVMANIDRLKKANIDYNILCVVDQQVAREPEKVFHSLKEHGYLQFIPCLDGFHSSLSEYSLDAITYGEFLTALFALYEQAFRSGHFVSIRAFDNWVNMAAGHPNDECAHMGRCLPTFLVESNGNVYPCDFYSLDEWLLGNVNGQSLFRIAKSPVGAAFCEASYTVHEKCRSCQWQFLCHGGCRRDREPMCNGELGLNRLCEGYQRFFQACYSKICGLAMLPPPQMP